jgi:predicted MPP superfamily phosphohydrolase
MTVSIALFAAPLFVYVGCRLSTAISGRFKVSKKIVLAVVFAVILWFYIYPVAINVYRLTGNLDRLFVFKPGLNWQDYILLYPFWWGFIFIAETVTFFLILDIITALSRLKIFSVPVREKWRKIQEVLKIGISAFFLVYVGVRSYIDTNHVRTVNYRVALQNLPVELHHLKLCLSGDIHVDRYTKDKKCEKLNRIVRSGSQDLLFFAGDLISRGAGYVDPAFDILCEPKPGTASFACMGDHDFWYAPRAIPLRMQACGWYFLQNAHQLINYKGKKILVTGITYVYSWRLPETDLNRLLARAPAADLKILLVHQPMEIPVKAAAKYGYHLLLGGHTHGGQVVPHIFGIPVTASLEETPYLTGPYRFKNLHVIITNGIGLTLAPLRYHAPAEITNITLIPLPGKNSKP